MTTTVKEPPRWLKPVVVIGGVLVALLIAAILVVPAFVAIGESAAAPNPGPTATSTPGPTPSASPSSETCDAAYRQTTEGETVKVSENFSVEQGNLIVANLAGATDAQRDLLITFAGHNARALNAWTHGLGLHDGKSSWTTLVKDGCLTSEAIDLHSQFKGILKAKGTTFAMGEAPANGYNSGYNGDVYGVDAQQGVGGDRTAIVITLPDGTKMYVMVRCGNPVYPGKPNLPDVPTDNPPPTTPPHEEGKNPALDPYPRGNAPTGGGKNADSGPGQYIPPSEMVQPPSTPRVNPAPPAAQPPAQSPGRTDPVPTPDPAPAPAPQPSAPTQSNPETGCDASVPGVSC